MFSLPLLSLTLLLHGAADERPLTLPMADRPEWVRREGVVMAWSMEPLFFRPLRDGAKDCVPTPEQRAAYLKEQSSEVISQLRELGVNLVMIHCYKGAGVQAERESMTEAAGFARRLHDAGLRVAVYTCSGTLFWEPFFKEMPQAKDWLLLDAEGKPRTYGKAAYRYWYNRNHPDAQAYYHNIVRFAVQEVGTDLLHLDNHIAGPGRDAMSAERFRSYLRATFRSNELAREGITDLNAVQPPMTGPPKTLLRRAWLDFTCQSLADSYRDMARCARTLRKDVLVECNPTGPGERITPPVDHGRLLQGGEAFWDESVDVGYSKGQLKTRIRTYKVARRMDNMAFCYVNTALQMAESMAFNLDCLGALFEFEYGDIHVRRKPIPPCAKPYTEFFHRHRDVLRDASVVADVAVLRSFPSQVFAEPQHPARTGRVEQALIEHRVCFQIIYDQHLADLSRYRVLVLAGCPAMSDAQIARVRSFVKSGGRLCVWGPIATHDEWMRPRPSAGLGDLPAAQIVVASSDGEIVEGICRALEHRPSLSVDVRFEDALAKSAVGQAIYSDRDYQITGMPQELVGLPTICLSHDRTRQDSSLRFRATAPVRVYAAFAPIDHPTDWLKPPDGWQLYKSAALKTNMKYFGAVMDIHCIDLPAGEHHLFAGRKGNYALIGIQPKGGGTVEPGVPTDDVGVCVELTEQPKRRMVHLVNYRTQSPARNVVVRLASGAGRTVRSVALISPDREGALNVPFFIKDHEVSFTVPQVKVYEIAVVTTDE